MTSTDQGVDVTGYAYDGDGQRNARSLNGALQGTYAWDTVGGLPELALERDAAGVVSRRYLEGPIGPLAESTGLATAFLHRDLAGSITDATDGSGAVTYRYRYHPFGEQRQRTVVVAGSPEPSARFAGEGLDSVSGLYHLPARQYDPATGRFGATDPLAAATDAAYMSAYTYADNRPGVLGDPSGLATEQFYDANCVGPMVRAFRVLQGQDPALRTLYDQAKTACGQTRIETAGGFFSDWRAGWGEFQGYAVKAGKIAWDVSGTGAVVTAIKNRDIVGLGIAVGTFGGKGKLLGLARKAFVRRGERAARAVPVPVSNVRRVTRRGPCSFSPDTPVMLADGSFASISQINVGDLVAATDPVTGESTGQTVTALLSDTDEDLVDLVVSGSDGYRRVVHTTSRHPFWEPVTRSWTPAGRLRPGDRLQALSGERLTVTATRQPAGRRVMFNLTVEGVHTFHVQTGPDTLLVHNTCRAPWAITPRGTAARAYHSKFKILYKSKSDGFWWSKDLAGHGGSTWKVFREEADGLHWHRDANKFGDFLKGKHKGPVGLLLPWKDVQRR